MPKFYFPTDQNWIQVDGPDAADFLQRLTTVHVPSLKVGEGANGAILTPQGKFWATFTLWNLGTHFGLETASHEILVRVIHQYTFSEKMTLTTEPHLICGWIFDDSFQTPLKTFSPEEGVQICEHPGVQWGVPYRSIWATSEKLEKYISSQFGEIQNKKDILSEDELLKMRIESCRPAPNSEMSFETSPLEVGVPDFIAQNKGCYPGQEIIEKIQALGSPAKRLIEIEGELIENLSEITLPWPLMNGADTPAEVGVITSLWRNNHEFKALAIVRKNYINTGLEVKAFQGEKLALRGTIKKVAPYQ